MKSEKKQSRDSSKGNTAVLFNRYVWLVDTIYRAGHISFEEINEQWERSLLNDTGEELPLKTFHNHKNAISRCSTSTSNRDITKRLLLNVSSSWQGVLSRSFVDRITFLSV